MSAAAKLLEELSMSGVLLSRHGDRLVLDGPVAILSETLVGRTRACKAEILRTIDVWAAEDRRAFFEERAAILEFDGGFSRREAEMRALEECFEIWRGRRKGH